MKRACRCPRVKHQHGTYTAYESDRCRCTRCALAYSRWKRAWLAGEDRERATIDGSGTRRRLQALTVMGWSPPELALRLGMNEQSVLRLRNSSTARRVLPATYGAVRDLYDQLWNRRSPGLHSQRLTNLALRKGWHPPLAWDDDEIDNPAAKPHEPGNGTWDHKPCGTLAAYRRHLRAGEKPCAACAAANRRNTQERAARKAAA